MRLARQPPLVRLHAFLYPRPRTLQCRQTSVYVYAYVCNCVCILSILFYVHLFTVLDSEICTAGSGRHGTALTFSQIANEYVFFSVAIIAALSDTHMHTCPSHLYRSLRSQLAGHTRVSKRDMQACRIIHTLAHMHACIHICTYIYACMYICMCVCV